MFVCTLTIYSFYFNLRMLSDLSCVAVIHIKHFFTHLSIQSLPAIYNSLKARFLFHTSVCIAARVESVMYLCAVFSHRQILSFSPLPPGGFSYLAGHAHGPESILWRYLNRTSEFVSQYLFFYTFLPAPVYITVISFRACEEFCLVQPL